MSVGVNTRRFFGLSSTIGSTLAKSFDVSRSGDDTVRRSRSSSISRWTRSVQYVSVPYFFE
jgi:hypothetical protein